MRVQESGPMALLFQRLGPKVLIWFTLTFLVIWTATPIIWAILSSFKDPLEIYESKSLLPEVWRLDAYRKVLSMPGFSTWLMNSVIVTVVATIVPLILAILAAYGFARYAFKFRHVLLLLYLIPRIIPRVSLIVPLNDLMSDLGLINTYSVLFITYIASAVPLATWILVGFFGSIPKEIEESATLDGANMWNRLRHVMLPMAWPGVVTAAVLCLREAWNEFSFVLALVNQTDMRTLPYQLYMLKDSMGIQDYAVYNAFTILTVLPLLLVYLLLERKVVDSIVSGAVKS
ncbi:carbohydrate ABC transporter permease [Pseudotabrizicola sediminis]|uniref:Carbohydrate ABC transporter permease n=1 Tax=Pseudotabrizicola sediminis TaxID=2486418 RepID=A0ABY2KJP4_9RHOB|nr:carbohydrate ABC transporter permease [Pseudotabrizicola sediminis]TGD42645.1 carbohydrate ABC transporter permease [Pseudotabrizicola sediminis]